MLNWLIVCYYLAFMGLSSALFFIIAVILWAVTRPFDRRLRLLHLFTCAWASLYTIIVPNVHVKVEGREKIREEAVYVGVSNHQSLLDVLMIFRVFFHFKWVSKIEIFWIPFIGWNMILNRYVSLKRGKKRSVEKMMKTCEERIDEGSSVFFFPEGTRSEDGVMRQFRPGAFALAKKKRVPILPIVFAGTGRVLPKHTLRYGGPRTIYIRVLDEIPLGSFERLAPEETAAMVRDIMARELDAMNRLP